MKRSLCVLLGLWSGANLAATPASVPASASAPKPTPIPRSSPGAQKSGDYVFSLLPKAFQREPTLEMTVNTEFTDYGRLLRAASPEQPVYYQALSAGFKSLGAAVGGEHPPPPADLERAMKKALAVNGFLPIETPGALPSLLVVYYWGSHNALDEDTRKNFPDLAKKNKLERAILVGGKKYAMEEDRVMEWGESLIDQAEKKQFLREQITDDIYYVVASAYDYASVAQGQRKLAWRTSMTVNTRGVSMSETLTPLIATAGPFFGRETTEPQIDVRRVPRNTRVEVGVPSVVEEKPPKP